LQLLTISDLQTDWQPLLSNVGYLGQLYDHFKRHDSGDRDIPVHIHGESTREAGVHASEVSGCLRRLVYGIQGTQRRVKPEDVNINMRRRFQLGHMLHALTQDDFDLMCMQSDGRLVFSDEVNIHPGMGGVAETWKIHSHCDGIFTFLNEQYNPYLRVGLEIKTMSADMFDKATKPLDYHLDQVCIYMKALELPLMWMFYYNKSNSNWTKPMAPYLITFDHKLWGRLEQRMMHAYTVSGSGQLPERQEGMPCTWCPFAWTCEPTTLKRRNSPSPKPGDFR